MVNKNIIKIRNKLDKLDNSLLDIIKKRTNLVNLVLSEFVSVLPVILD